MSSYSILPLLTAIYIILLGIFVYFNNRKSVLNRILAGLSVSLFIWLIGYAIMYSTKSESLAVKLAKFLFIGVIFIPVTDHHFTMRFLNKKNQGKIIVLSYVLGVIFSFASLFSKDFIVGVSSFFWGYQTKVGRLNDIFLAFFFILIIRCWYYVYIEYKINTAGKTQDQLRRIKYVFWAFFLGNLGAIDFVSDYGIGLYPIGSINIALFVSIIAYAIIRHQLLDIEVVIKKTLVFAGLLASVFGMLILPTLVIQEYLFRGAGTGGRIAGLTISGIIIIFTMRRIENFLVNTTDKYLFQKKYDYKELLKTFTAEVLTVLELDKLVNLTIDKLVDIVKLNSAAVLLLDSEKQQFNIVASHNIKDQSVTLIRPDGIVTFMEETHGYILIKEMREKKIIIPDSIQEIINKLNAELIIPMVLHEEVIGILSLGKKKSDEDYTQDDLDILLPLAKTLAIAISNAELFVELGRAQAEAAQREKMVVIGTLAAGMAHEIRNPITTIKIFAEFLKDKKDDPDFIAKFERIVPKEVEKINHMITTLLEFSKPADIKSMGSVDIKNALQDVIEILGNEMVLKDIILDENIGDVSEVYGNKKYIQEILFNLIENSVHAIDRRGTITIKAEEDDASVYINIEDTGCGISEANIAHIFEPFFTTKMSQEGVGLGLYVIRQLMLRMKASIGLESEEGRGTTFKLKFEKTSRNMIR